MPESKSGALTSLAIPLHNRLSVVQNCRYFNGKSASDQIFISALNLPSDGDSALLLSMMSSVQVFVVSLCQLLIRQQKHKKHKHQNPSSSRFRIVTAILPLRQPQETVRRQLFADHFPEHFSSAGKVRYSDGLRVSCQLLCRKYYRRRYVNTRFYDDKPAFWCLDSM